MEFFSEPPGGPRRRPERAVDGNLQEAPEGPGTLQRRARLFGACARQLADDPLAQPRAFGVPIGDGLGLEELVAEIAPLFAREQSLIRWVALRGALAHLYIHTVDPGSRSTPFQPTVEEAMGVSRRPDDTFAVVAHQARRLTAGQREAATSTVGSVWRRLSQYARYSNLSVHQVNTERPLQVGPAIGLDIIAWAAIAALRIGHDFSAYARPDELDQPGWYAEPLFGNDERYWDGQDWTAFCRPSEPHPVDLLPLA